MREPHPAPAPARRDANAIDEAANDRGFRVVDAGWWLGRWEPYLAGSAWRLRSARGGGWVDFYGGNAQPLQLGQADAAALAVALNRRVASMQARRETRSNELPP
jgi:hypothetical protein